MATVLDAATLRRACDLAERVLVGVDDDQLTDPTPCTEWAVRDVMEHVVGATDFFADVAEHGASPEGRDWPDYAPDDLGPAFRRHAQRLLAAFESDGAMDRRMLLPSGESTGEKAIQVAIAELFVHSWDLATATRQPFGDGDIADALLGSDYMALCTQVRTDPSAPFAAELPTSGSSPPVDRLMAILGRDPELSTR